MCANINREFYYNLFCDLWEAQRYEQAIEVYEYVGRIFERAKYVAEYYASKGLLDRAMVEYEFFIESCPSQISHNYLPYPSGPKELYLLGKWFERTEPLKAEGYLKLYLQADQFTLTMGEGIVFKTEAEEILKRIQNANR